MAGQQENVKGYDLATDLYLEMLRDAQRIEDKKLAKLICRRISDRTRQLNPHLYPTGVIPFPASYIGSAARLDHIDNGFDGGAVQIDYVGILKIKLVLVGTIYLFLKFLVCS